MKISNATANKTVTSKQNFTEKYHRLMKNLYNQNCSWKNEGNINRVSEISKIHSLHGFFLLQPTWIFHLSNKTFRKHLKFNIIQPISVTFATVQFEKLHHKGISLNNVCVQWVFTIINFSQNSAKYCGVCQLQKNNSKILGYFEFATPSEKLLVQQEKLWCSWRFQNNVSTLNLWGTKRRIQNHVEHLR